MNLTDLDSENQIVFNCCPICGNQFENEFNIEHNMEVFCTNCGTSIANLFDIFENPVDTYRICPNCHQISDSRLSYCLACSSSLGKTTYKLLNDNYDQYLNPLNGVVHKIDLKSKSTKGKVVGHKNIKTDQRMKEINQTMAVRSHFLLDTTIYTAQDKLADNLVVMDQQIDEGSIQNNQTNEEQKLKLISLKFNQKRLLISILLTVFIALPLGIYMIYWGIHSIQLEIHINIIGEILAIIGGFLLINITPFIPFYLSPKGKFF
ncbi:MAG: hypothetical protein ACFFDW_07435 [Candidatus Thorarchaeota archaeon]